jgi:uncharacterized membrane protein YfcA
MSNLVFLAVAIINCVAIIAWAVTAFGNAIVFHIGWHICLLASDGEVCDDNIPLIVMYITFSGIMVYPLQVWRLRKWVNWPLALNFAVAQICGVIIGSFILFSFSSIWIVRVLGIVFYVVSIQKAFGMLNDEYGAPPPPRMSERPSMMLELGVPTRPPTPPSGSPVVSNQKSNKVIDFIPGSSTSSSSRQTAAAAAAAEEECGDVSTRFTEIGLPPSHTDFVPYEVKGWNRVFVYFAGLLSGITSGMLGTGGPVLIWFATAADLAPLECRGTFSFGNSLEGFTRLVYIFFIQDSLHHIKDANNLYMFFLIALTSILSFVAGNWLANYVTPKIFHIILLVLLSIGSVMIGIQSLPVIPSLIVIFSAGGFFFLCVALFFFFYVRPTRAAWEANCGVAESRGGSGRGSNISRGSFPSASELGLGAGAGAGVVSHVATRNPVQPNMSLADSPSARL